jgi:hypothetical protein
VRGDGGHPVEDVRQRAPRHDGVLHRQVGGDPAHGAERLLPALPEPGPLRGRGGGAHLGGAVPQEERLDQRGLRLRGFRGSIHFHEQHRSCIGRIAGGVDGRLHGPHTGLVHHLHGGRDDAGCDDPAHRLAGGANRGEGGEQGADRCRQRLETEGDLGGDAEHAFAADEEPDQVGTPRLAAPRAEPHQFRVRQEDLEGRDVGGDLHLRRPPAFSVALLSVRALARGSGA